MSRYTDRQTESFQSVVRFRKREKGGGGEQIDRQKAFSLQCTIERERKEGGGGVNR